VLPSTTPPLYLGSMKKNPAPTARKISLGELEEAIGGTWFEMQEEEDRIVLDTRENGDVGAESPGSADLEEAKRLASIVRKKFPRHEVRLEAVDEWVVMEVVRQEKSPERLAREAREKAAVLLRDQWRPHVDNALAVSAQKCLGENAQSKNYAPPFSWNRSVSPGPRSCATTFRAGYGERHLYRDHLGAIPAFKTPEECRAHFLELVSNLGGTVKAERVTPPHKNLTYNRRPPNNVIEEVGHVSYDVELPRTPPRLAKSLGKAKPLTASTLSRGPTRNTSDRSK
jgi:hypothetical protein